MKRVLLLILLIMLVAWFAGRRQAHGPARLGHPRADVVVRSVSHDRHEARRAASEARREAQRIRTEAQREAQEAIRQAAEDARQAAEEAHHAVREALADVHEELGEALEDVGEELRENVDGIPVSIVRGTRVDQASPEPPGATAELPECPLAGTSPEPPAPPAPPPAPAARGLASKHGAPRPHASPSPAKAKQAAPKETLVIAGLVSGTEQEARDEARKALDRKLTDWLEPQGVPRSWSPSSRQVDEMIVDTRVEPVVKDYGTVYVGKLTVDASPERRDDFVKAYQQQLVNRRMVLLGGGLAFLLTCLGVVSGYIRADEATKGYYTNRLRLLAAAGVGAAGTAIYHMIA